MANSVLEKEIKQMDPVQLASRRKKLWRIKRVQDVILSVLALVVLSPFMLLLALAIVIDDPKGGPIYTQTRVGKDGREFSFYKFRSMRKGAEDQLDDLLDQNEMEGPAFKIKNDPRITRIGRFIRRASIDELPQLINILKGDMSIVGPRPPLPREVEQYTAYQKQKFYVLPGLTCFWQIQPKRNDMPFDEWVELDLKYIREESYWLDWKLIFLTFGAVLGMNGI